jgi:uncharacterized protein
MQPDEVVQALATAGIDLPRDAMQWALDHWEQVAPRLLGVLEAYAEGTDRSDDAASAVFFIAHLVGEKGDARAFAPLCRLARDEDALETALGDATTETLSRILISTYDGDLDALKEVVEDEEADDLVRSGALEAMAYLTATGHIPRENMEDYLWRLHREMRPRDENYVWVGWATAAALLGFGGFVDKVRDAIRRKWVPFLTIDYAYFEETLRLSRSDPDGMAGFERQRLGPFIDAIAELSGWHAFSEEYKANLQRRAAGDEPEGDVPDLLGAPEPYINPFRSVGRNDPCPCGSGKKFKNCCLQ